jgi:hypothetical protein
VTRRIVQIAAASPQSIGQRTALFALADDGTLWSLGERSGHNMHRWYPMPGLPETDGAA